MKLIEYIKTLNLEFSFIKEHIIKKTNERLTSKKLLNTKYKINSNNTISPNTYEIFKKYLN